MPKLKQKLLDNDVDADKENISVVNSSICAEDASEKMLTMENFLRDFDIQVKERIKNMETMMKKALGELTRLGNSEKLKISKDIRNMLVKDFVAKGGDLESLEFKELSEMNSTMDVSFAQQAEPVVEDPVVSTGGGGGRRKREPEPSLLQDTLKRNTRSRAAAGKKTNDLTTPVVRATKSRRVAAGRKGDIQTPMITPKFDPSKPLKSAREPHVGETLMSLSGSPVVTNQKDSSTADSSQLVAISMSADQAMIGGRLFIDENVSPNTLHAQKQVIEEAMAAINSRLEALDSQVGSKLDMS